MRAITTGTELTWVAPCSRISFSTPGHCAGWMSIMKAEGASLGSSAESSWVSRRSTSDMPRTTRTPSPRATMALNVVAPGRARAAMPWRSQGRRNDSRGRLRTKRVIR
jgi:hypothetical protein